MDDERTTKELIEVLGNDCDRCHAQLIAAIDSGDVDEDGAVDADYEFHARQLIRAIFAYIEAVTFSMKATSAWKCMEDGTEITPQERYFATDTEYEVNERGEIVESVAKLSLARNIRFAFVMHRKAHRDSAPFDASVEWWSYLKEAIRIRDRLTHPKMPTDLDVSGEEVVKVLKAKKGFEEEALRYASGDAA